MFQLARGLGAQLYFRRMARIPLEDNFNDVINKTQPRFKARQG